MSAKKDREVSKAIANVPDEAQQIDIIARLRRWFGSNISDGSYQIVQEYVYGEFAPKEAANKLLRPIDEACAANKLNDVDMTGIWYSIIHSAKRIPVKDFNHHQKLIELIKAIKAHPEPPRVQDKTIYSDLRDFGMAAREAMNDSPGCGAGYLEPEYHAYANIMYFFTLVTKSNLMNFWIYAIWEMRGALETPHADDEPNDAFTPITAAQKYDARVPAAATWVFSLGKELYGRERDLTPTSPNQGNPGGGGELWKGKAEFSKERWALWKSRFQEVSKFKAVTEDTRKIAREAAATMDECEKS